MKICNVENCGGAVLSKGWCGRHYRQVRKHGRVLENDGVKDLEDEVWVEIETGMKFFVSNLGRVKSLARIGKLIAPQTYRGKRDTRDVLRVYLDRRRSKEWVRFPYLHSLVAEAFIPNPERHSHINFKDGDSKNCSADNLIWEADNPQGSEHGLDELRANVVTATGFMCVSFAEGADNALDEFLLGLRPRMEGFLRQKFPWFGSGTIEDVVSDAIIDGLSGIKRGKLTHDSSVKSWFFAYGVNRAMRVMKQVGQEVSAHDEDGAGYDQLDRLAYHQSI